MLIHRLTVGPLECNCYLVADEASRNAAIIDPGGEAERILRECERRDLRPLYVVVTHAHADHIGAVPELKRRLPAVPLCIGRGDARLLADGVRNLSVMVGLCDPMPEPHVLLAEGDRLELGQSALRVLETPGHTPGGICLHAQEEAPPVVFCGDLVFRGGVGRTDLPGGDPQALRRSIEQKILALPDETRLLPGHGEPTTVGQEKRAGPPIW